MKLKNEVDSEELKLRLLKSFAYGTLVTIFLVFVYVKIKAEKKVGGASETIRKSFLLNEKISRALFSPDRMSVDKPRPETGKKMRVNGMLGLETPVFRQFYTIEVNSGEKSLRLNLEAFKSLPKAGFSTDFRCIEGWTEVLHYGGPSFAEFMKFYDIGKKPDGSYYEYVGLETPDRKYYVSIDMDSMLHPQTLLVYEMNGALLSNENGAPLRLVIPIKYGIKSIKRIGRIFFSDSRPPDYWAERGYDWYSGL